MTNWGALLIGSFLFLGLRRPNARRHTALTVVTLVVVILSVVAIRQHTP
jgi:hypothetical protein